MSVRVHVVAGCLHAQTQDCAQISVALYGFRLAMKTEFFVYTALGPYRTNQCTKQPTRLVTLDSYWHKASYACQTFQVLHN